MSLFCFVFPTQKQVTDSNRGGGGSRHPHGNHRNAGEAWNHRDQQHDRKDEKDLRDNQDDGNKNGPLKFSLREEMRTERMLITVSHDVAPPPNAKKEPDHKMERSRGKSEKTDGKKKSSKGDRGRDSSSNSSSEDGKDTRLKAKSPKMKKKKKKKTKKKAKS